VDPLVTNVLIIKLPVGCTENGMVKFATLKLSGLLALGINKTLKGL